MDTICGLKQNKVTSVVGAVVEGVDLRKPLSPEVAMLLRKALVENGAIFFRNQDLTVAQFWSFMEYFGTPHKEESTGTDEDRPEDVMTADLSPTRHATAVWHADTTSLAVPPWATALRAIQPTSLGGDTCWSSMYAAWDALSEPMRRVLDGLTAAHSAQRTLDRMEEQHAAIFEMAYSGRNPREQIHPVVLTHAETGRKALYVNESFTTRIVELTSSESATVLSMLFRHVEKPDLCVRWKWSPNDAAFWDDHAVQHYAVPDYESSRVMQRIVLAGNRLGQEATCEAG